MTGQCHVDMFGSVLCHSRSIISLFRFPSHSKTKAPACGESLLPFDQCRRSSSPSNATNALPCRKITSPPLSPSLSLYPHVLLTCIPSYSLQVKQQKKSSNKWTCVICNEKQSVRKVFARGFLARDVRKFVQSFNLSRQNGEETLTAPSSESRIGSDSSPSGSFQKKKRSDWAEYLGHEEHSFQEEEGFGFESEIEIVTELPKEMKQLLKPVFRKRKQRPVLQLQDNHESNKCPKKMAKQACKWSDYLETENDKMFEIEKGSPNPYNSWNGEGVLQSQFNDQRVEEDIHPNFM
ncbi:uncharacterized protein LOC131248364 [Magnolia sinica]|uniref:uncharacterized protein LOC131248364 n=1 Tax=Magnolia sinica TaxID=86752 RepID=UPI00265A1428|nr:uncharacterized protein LOC131248364 [Magnolia sinica]